MLVLFKNLFLFVIFSLILFSSQSAYALFEDSEARREIIKLRQQIKELDLKLSESLDILETSKQGRLELLNSIEQLNEELSFYRGYTEKDQENSNQIEFRLKLLENSIELISERLTALEPKSVSVLGEEFLVNDNEKELYEKATEKMSNGEYEISAQLFERFNEKFPNSNLTAYALHSNGAANYALKNYKKSIAILSKLERGFLDYPKLPDALLTLAACLTEIKKTTKAQKTLKKILEIAPSSDAALTAKERLKQLTQS